MFGTIAIEMKDAEAGPLLGAADGGGGRIVLAGRKNAVSQRGVKQIALFAVALPSPIAPYIPVGITL